MKVQDYPKLWLKFVFKFLLPRHAKKRAKAQGMARHSVQEQHRIIMNNLKNLDDLLGE